MLTVLPELTIVEIRRLAETLPFARATMLPADRLPVMLAVPVMLAPDVVAMILVVPPTVMLTLPFAVGIAMFDVPLAKLPPDTVVHDKTFEPLVVST